MCNFDLFTVFPAGILQGRFFAADRPAYLNYGAIGFVIGHEITHGFDTKGRQFDGLGNVHTWWQPETLDRFLNKTECVEYQFGNYTEPLTNLKVREKWGNSKKEHTQYVSVRFIVERNSHVGREYRRQRWCQDCLQCVPELGARQRR